MLLFLKQTYWPIKPIMCFHRKAYGLATVILALDWLCSDCMETQVGFSLIIMKSHLHLPGLRTRTCTSGCVVFNDRRAGTAAVCGAGNLKDKGWRQEEENEDERSKEWESMSFRKESDSEAKSDHFFGAIDSKSPIRILGNELQSHQ